MIKVEHVFNDGITFETDMKSNRLMNQFNQELGCVWESLFTAYLSLSSRINTFNKNYRYLEELYKNNL